MKPVRIKHKRIPNGWHCTAPDGRGSRHLNCDLPTAVREARRRYLGEEVGDDPMLAIHQERARQKFIIQLGGYG